MVRAVSYGLSVVWVVRETSRWPELLDVESAANVPLASDDGSTTVGLDRLASP